MAFSGNTLTALLQTVLARAMVPLREWVRLPMLVRNDISMDLEAKGKTIRLSIAPNSGDVIDVTAGRIRPDDADNLTPQYVDISLDYHKKTPGICLSLREAQEIAASTTFIPDVLVEKAGKLGSYIAHTITDLTKQSYNYVGSPTCRPFESATPSIDIISEAHMKMVNEDAWEENWAMILGPHAAYAARNLPVFQKVNEAGSIEPRATGRLGQVFGFNTYEQKYVYKHITGAAGTPLLDFGGGYAVGAKTIHMDGLTVKPAEGDIFSYSTARAAGTTDTQTYVVVSSTDLDTLNTDVTFEPGLKVALAAGDDNCPISFLASHTANLAFQKNALAYISRQILPNVFVEDNRNSRMFVTLPDPISGLILTLSVVPEYFQDTMELSALFGCGVVRRGFMCRVIGQLE